MTVGIRMTQVKEEPSARSGEGGGHGVSRVPAGIGTLELCVAR